MIHEPAISLKEPGGAIDALSEQNQWDVTRNHEAHHPKTVLGRAPHEIPHNAYQHCEQQRLDHDPEEADVVPPEARQQLTHHERADHASLNTQTLGKGRHLNAPASAR